MPAIIKVVDGRTIISVNGAQAAYLAAQAGIQKAVDDLGGTFKGDKGDTGPANNTYTDLAAFKAQLVTNEASTLVVDGVRTDYSVSPNDESGNPLAVESTETPGVWWVPLSASGIANNIGLTGSTDGDASQLFRETVALSRFVPPGIFTDLMNGDHTGDISAYINSALDSGENIINPFRLSCIAAPIQIKYNGQSFTARGTYNNEIRWLTNEPTLNMVELLSGRRDGGSGGASTTQAVFSGAELTSAAGSAVANAVWIEDGVFHSRVENIRLLNFMGSVGESYIQLNDGAAHTSYPVGTVLRDITGTAVYTGAIGAPIPRGVWVRSGIESKFQNVAMFGVGDAWVLGDSGPYRTVEDSRWYDCHVEMGDRDGGTNNGTGVRLYGGSNLNFFAMKINSGINDDPNFPNVTDQTCVEFMDHPDLHPMRNVNFWGSRLWQVNPQSRELVYINSGADADKVLFDSTRVVGVTNTPGFIGQSADFDGDIQTRNTNYSGISKATPLASLAGRRNVTHDAASLAAGGFATFNLGDDEGAAYGVPIAVSANINRQGVHLSWYKTSATGVSAFSLWNPPDGSAQDFAAARYAIRHYQPEDIRAAVSKTWDPPAINTNIGTTTTIALPGVRLGDFVKAGFRATTAGGMASAICEAWVSADNVVSVRLFNPNINKNFAPDPLTVFHLAPTFDYITSTVYDPPSLATLTSTGTSAISVPGAALGDFVEVSFSNDLAGVFMWGEVTAADTVTVRLFNSTTGTVDLASGTVTVGVRKRHTRF